MGQPHVEDQSDGGYVGSRRLIPAGDVITDHWPTTGAESPQWSRLSSPFLEPGHAAVDCAEVREDGGGERGQRLSVPSACG